MWMSWRTQGHFPYIISSSPLLLLLITFLCATISHLTYFPTKEFLSWLQSLHLLPPSPFSASNWLSPLRAADASAMVLGGPASPLAVQVSDVNKDYVFLTWQPPSADGVSPVEGYYVEKWGQRDLKYIIELETISPRGHFSSCYRTRECTC